MTIAEQRESAIALADKAGAIKTLELIQRPDSGYDEILQSAIQELGIDKLAPIILEQNDPNWALYALRNVADAGEFQQALIRQASALHTNMEAVGDEASFGEVKRISSFKLEVVAGASYAASFTMYWFDPALGQLPLEAYADTSQYKFSDQVPVFQSTSRPCSYFALPRAPLNPNNTVWMIVTLCGVSKWFSTNYRFTYDPTTSTQAIISASGGLASPQFSARVSS